LGWRKVVISELYCVLKSFISLHHWVKIIYNCSQCKDLIHLGIVCQYELSCEGKQSSLTNINLLIKTKQKLLQLIKLIFWYHWICVH